MMKKLTKEEVFDALRATELDFKNDVAIYWLYITDGEISNRSWVDGNWVEHSADACFSCGTGDEDEYFHQTRNADFQAEVERLEELIDSDDEATSSDAWEELKYLRENRPYDERYYYSMDDYCDKESKDDPDFMAIVEDLTEQANRYLESLEQGDRA